MLIVASALRPFASVAHRHDITWSSGRGVSRLWERVNCLSKSYYTRVVLSIMVFFAMLSKTWYRTASVVLLRQHNVRWMVDKAIDATRSDANLPQQTEQKPSSSQVEIRDIGIHFIWNVRSCLQDAKFGWKWVIIRYQDVQTRQGRRNGYLYRS